MKTVRMIVTFPGMMGGVTLPRQGETVSLTDTDADLLIERGYAAPVAKTLPAPAVETRVTETPEARPGRPVKKSG